MSPYVGLPFGFDGYDAGVGTVDGEKQESTGSHSPTAEPAADLAANDFGASLLCSLSRRVSCVSLHSQLVLDYKHSQV